MRWILLLLALCSPSLLAQDTRPTAPLAWLKFTDGQTYAGEHYRFLDDGDLQITVDLAPSDQRLLELRWGAKNDQRAANLTINGRKIALKQGGYDGFKPLVVPLTDLPAGDKIQLTLSRPQTGKAAFISQIRLLGPDAAAAADPKAAIFRMTLLKSPPPPRASGGEAFPEMRALWDRTPPAATLPADPTETAFRRAEANARQAAEALYRCRRFVDGWLAHADPATGLIPRNLNESRDFWNGRDSAADNYPFMVLTCALTDRDLFQGRMLDMLKTETRLTSRIDRLCDDYSFSKRGWRRESIDLDAIIFDSSEYVKDGLLPLTEWLGPSPWSQRMVGLIDDVWKNAAIDTPQGKLPTLNFEVNGDLLQACSRLYWFTGQRKYLDWAIRLGDYYLLGNHHPTRNAQHLTMSDHACEVLNGLSELYVACAQSAPDKREQYRKPLHEIYDTVLAHGVHEHGLLCQEVNLKTGVQSRVLTDNWGYNFDGIYTAWLVDRTPEYRDAIRRALSSLKPHYSGYAWQGGSADGYADSIEGAINLLNREPVESGFEWVDAEIRTMWSKQRPDGVIEGWHGDGNSARTSIMYALWKTQGTHLEPWRDDVRLGAVMKDGKLLLSLASDRPWKGRLLFDRPRHKVNMKLPLDYPRINQFPEWFTVRDEAKYSVATPDGAATLHSGADMARGVEIELPGGRETRWIVSSQ